VFCSAHEKSHGRSPSLVSPEKSNSSLLVFFAFFFPFCNKRRERKRWSVAKDGLHKIDQPDELNIDLMYYKN
jgi:hypothetical protein